MVEIELSWQSDFLAVFMPIIKSSEKINAEVSFVLPGRTDEYLLMTYPDL